MAEGKAERIGFDESCKLAWQRGGLRRVVVARVKYRFVPPTEFEEAYYRSKSTQAMVAGLN